MCAHACSGHLDGWVVGGSANELNEEAWPGGMEAVMTVGSAQLDYISSFVEEQTMSTSLWSQLALARAILKKKKSKKSKNETPGFRCNGWLKSLVSVS